MPLKNYNAKQVTIIFSGFILTGYAKGDFCNVEMSADAWSHQVGTDGEECRSRQNDESGKVTVKLAQYSSSNQRLADLHAADKAANSGVAPLLVNDKSGFSLHATDEAYILVAPKAQYSNDAGDREWVFMCAGLNHYVGGN